MSAISNLAQLVKALASQISGDDAQTKPGLRQSDQSTKDRGFFSLCLPEGTHQRRHFYVEKEVFDDAFYPTLRSFKRTSQTCPVVADSMIF